MPGCFVGAGLRSAHYAHLLGRPRTPLLWFEAVSENYMDSEGRPLRVLEALRRDYPVALHGVSMSVGSVEGVRPEYLRRLKALAARVQPFLVSDHLCWTGADGSNVHDLLPLPYTREALELVAGNARRVQEALGREIALENVSSYLSYPGQEFTEWEFLAAVARSSGCKILLDVNNVYVNSVNHGFAPERFVDAIPAESVAQIHLAGYTDMGTHLFDTHSCPVSEPVWRLFARVIARMPEVPVLIEWDEDVPEFPELERQALLAREIWEGHHGPAASRRAPEPAGALHRG